VEIAPRVGAADDHDDELRILPDHLRAHRGLEQVAMVIDPAFEIEGAQRL
jgi:hypothetical protein